MTQTERTIPAPLRLVLNATTEEWASDPRLRDVARRLLIRLPPGLEREEVLAFFTRIADLDSFPLFSAHMPPTYFAPYARLRAERSHSAFLADLSEDLFSVSSYLFRWDGPEQMRTYDQVAVDEPARLAFLLRQRLVEVSRRFVAIPYFKVGRFRALADEPVILDAARHHLANPWFLAECELVESGQVTRRYHRFDIRLWAACKLVLRLAGEPGLAPGPEPPPVEPS